MAIDSRFVPLIERNLPVRDIPAHSEGHVRHHDTSTIQHDRGTVLTVNLTNRYNMMFDPCFIDVNQVGFVHGLSGEDIKKILDNAVRVEPRRKMPVQFSGGEPTMSP